MNVLKKRGRPSGENVRGVRYTVRLSKEEDEMLSYVSTKRHQKRTDVIRQAIKTQYLLEKNKEY